MQRKPLVWIGGRRRQLPTGDTLAGAEPPIEAGDAQQYYRGDKTWSNLASAVRSVVLTGLSTATNAAIVATDTILQALGKLQAQLNAKAPLDSPEFSPFVKVTNAGNSGFALRNSNLSLPNYSSLIFGPPLDTDEFGRVSLNASANGGVAFNGFTNAANAAAIPLTFIGYHGHTSPTGGAIEFWGWKHNGATSRTTLADNEILWQVRNGTTQRVRILGDGTFLPATDNTSDLGLSTNRFRVVYAVTTETRFPKVIGSGVGDANVASIQFYESDGTTRKGFVGDASIANSSFYVGSDAGDILFQRVGSVKLTLHSGGATVNGTLDASGTLTASGTNNRIGNHIISGNFVELGSFGGGDRSCFLDFHSDDTNTDHSARIIRNSGVNGTLDIRNIGSGNVLVRSAGGTVVLHYNDSARMTMTSTGVDITGIVNSYGLSPLVTVSATSKTFALADAGTYQRFTSGSATTCTVPTNASVAYPIGSEIHIRRAANANLTIVAASGVTINAPSGGTLVLTNNMTCTLKKVGTDTWDLIGQTVAA